jgi:hypothetical protein
MRREDTNCELNFSVSSIIIKGLLEKYIKNDLIELEEKLTKKG